jgi:type IV pilus assembly protein PilW
MVALAIAGVVMVAVVTTFRFQQAGYVAQEEVVVMQQNLRAAMSQMTRELHMAGYDPTGIAEAGISVAAANSITFSYLADNDTQDNDNDGTPDEAGELHTITYSLYVPYAAEGNTATAIGRSVNAARMPLAENIQALEFIYLDAAGNVTAILDNIATVQVSILARADRPDPEFVNTLNYFPASCPQPAPPAAPNDGCVAGTAWDFDGAVDGRNAFNDNFRRRLLITAIHLRN